MALDPFHDYNVKIQGYPDRTNVPTASQFIKRTVSVTRPVGLDPGDSWDCHVFTLPVMTTKSTTEQSFEQDRSDCSTGGTTKTMGMLNVRKQRAGSPSFPHAGGLPLDQETYGYSPTDENDESEIRLIAGGFEVHNDTADLYKNGSVTVYSQLNGWSDPTLKQTGSVPGGLGMVQTSRQPPATRSLATQLTDARTWEAREGCYVPIRLDVETGHGFKPRVSNIPVLKQQESGVGDAWKTCGLAENITPEAGSLTARNTTLSIAAASDALLFAVPATLSLTGAPVLLQFSTTMAYNTSGGGAITFELLRNGAVIYTTVEAPTATTGTACVSFNFTDAISTISDAEYNVRVSNSTTASVFLSSAGNFGDNLISQLLAVIKTAGFQQTEGVSWAGANIETTGAYFSGLSYETVLTLDYRFITELAPTTANPSMLAMCSPSPPHDARALDCYTHCLDKLPPGVPVSMNAKGDFWKMVLKTAATVTPYLTPLAGLAGPEAMMAAELGNLALQATNKAVQSKKSKKTPQTQSSRSVGPNNTYRKQRG